MTLTQNSRNKIFAIFLLGSCISTFIYTAISTALAPIMEDMQITAGTVQWLISIFSLVMGTMVLATPFLVRRFTSRALYIAAMSLFCAGLLLSAVAATFFILLAGRILQAAGCGMLASLTQVVVLTIFPADKRGGMMGIYGLAMCILPVIAPTLTGIVVDVSSWRMIFWCTLAVSLVILVVGAFGIQNIFTAEKPRFDICSMSLCTCGFLGIILGLGNWSAHAFVSLPVLLPISAGLAALAVFVRRQTKLEVPFLNLCVFSDANYRVSAILGILIYCGMMAASTLLPLYMQSLRGFSATVTGLSTMPGSIITAAASMISGKLYDKFGVRKVFLTGAAILTSGTLAFCFLSETTTVGLITVLFAYRSVGVGMLMMTIITWGMSTVPVKYAADGAAILSSLRTIASAVGIAVFVSFMSAVANSAGGAGNAVSLIGVQAAFAGVTLISAVILILAVRRVGVRQ